MYFHYLQHNVISQRYRNTRLEYRDHYYFNIDYEILLQYYDNDYFINYDIEFEFYTIPLIHLRT